MCHLIFPIVQTFKLAIQSSICKAAKEQGPLQSFSNTIYIHLPTSPQLHFTSTVVAFLWDSLHMPLSSAHGAGLRLQGSASASHQQPMDKMDKDEAQRNSSMLLPRWTVTKQIHPACVKCSSCRFGCGVSHVSLLINPHYRSTSRRSLRISLPWYHPDLDEPHPLGCQSPQLELLQAWKRPNKLWILLAPHQKNKYIYI